MKKAGLSLAGELCLQYPFRTGQETGSEARIKAPQTLHTKVAFAFSHITQELKHIIVEKCTGNNLWNTLSIRSRISIP